MANNKGTYTKKPPLQTPKLSLNSFSEYLDANASRRNRILSDAKFKNDANTGYYNVVNLAIVTFIKSGFDISHIDRCLEKFKKKTPETDYEKHNIPNSILMLETIKSNAGNMFDFEGMDFSIYARDKNNRLNISGVEINIFPDLIVTGITGKKKKIKILGGLKIHIGKDTMELVTAQKASMLLRYFLSLNHENQADTNYKWCISFDVFSNSWVTSPPSHTQMMKDVEKACREICALWPSIEE